MSNPIIQDIAEAEGATGTVNGSWLQAWANQLGATQTVNGSWLEAIANTFSPPLTQVNGTWIEAIAREYGATATVNGSWYQALYSQITGVVPPSNTVAPAVTGTNTVGQTLTCSTGTWTGTAPINYTYQWKRDGSTIGGETANTYVSLLSDIGKSITCVVTATNTAGNASATSNASVIDLQDVVADNGTTTYIIADNGTTTNIITDNGSQN